MKAINPSIVNGTTLGFNQFAFPNRKLINYIQTINFSEWTAIDYTDCYGNDISKIDGVPTMEECKAYC